MMKPGLDRARLRARLVLFALLPALSDILPRRPSLLSAFAKTRASIRIGAAHCDLASRLVLDNGHLNVLKIDSNALNKIPKDWDINLEFANTEELNRFFSGRAALPSVAGALRHPVLLGKTALLLNELSLFKPGRVFSSADERVLYVRATLPLIARALCELFLGGHPAMAELVNESPERVYQWEVSDIGAAVWLRMARGRIQAGRGIYTKRRPFVRYLFPRAEGAFRVLSSHGPAMNGLLAGDILPEGSPEYSRKLSILLQQADELLNAG